LHSGQGSSEYDVSPVISSSEFSVVVFSGEVFSVLFSLLDRLVSVESGKKAPIATNIKTPMQHTPISAAKTLLFLNTTINPPSSSFKLLYYFFMNLSATLGFLTVICQ